MRRILLSAFLLLIVVVVVESCGYDSSLREYLNRHFWLPFAKRTVPFERNNVRRVSVPYAGMDPINAGGSLGKLRAAYQQISREAVRNLIVAARQALEKASADPTLTNAEKDEVALINAKIDMRDGETANNDPANLKHGGDVDFVTARVRFGKYSMVHAWGPTWSWGLPLVSFFKGISQLRETDLFFAPEVPIAEYRGVRTDGTYFRWIGMLGETVEYDHVTKEAAVYFDGILDTLCWRHAPYGK